MTYDKSSSVVALVSLHFLKHFAFSKYMYFSLGSEDQLKQVSDDDIEFGFSQCKTPTTSGCCHFDDYAEAVYEDNMWNPPSTFEEGVHLYKLLRDIAT